MLRLLFACVLACGSALSQSAPSNPPVPVPPMAGSDQVPPDATVVEVQGLCDHAKSAGECKTVLTRRQFDTMLEAISVTAQINSPAAKRSLAEGYVQLLALADAGEQAGIDKDPHFQELMQIVRVRTLAEAYRHSLDAKYANPSADEISAYYNQHKEDFEQLRIDRISIPYVNSKLPPSAQANFARKARAAADKIRERAAAGEDMHKLQEEVSDSLGLTTPAVTDLGARKKGSLPSNVEKDVWSLKPGEVTKVEEERTGYNIYKVRSRDTMPLEVAKNDIIRRLHQENLQAAIKQIMDNVHTKLNEQFFAMPGGKMPAWMKTAIENPATLSAPARAPAPANPGRQK
ncbi:MAG TPA: peptidylprolyl isomerase [Terriglobales bacterium]|nr:peptidylprolyl isomerase [Terriglobales bacterium]